jgi:magnesium transporter
MAPEKKNTNPFSRRTVGRAWTDMEGSSAELREALKGEGLPASLVETALASGSLPKVDSEAGTTLWLFRSFDAEAEKRAASIRDLTRKLSLFARADGTIVTAHRFHAPVYGAGIASPDDVGCIVEYILNRVATSYADAIARSEDMFDELEAAVFHSPGSKSFRLKEAYFLKRRMVVIRKMLLLTLDSIDAAAALPAFAKTQLKPYRRRLSLGIGLCETTLDGVNQLLNLHLAFVSQKTNEASQRTNEVMRVLTVFSAFFLPLSFIAGVYGMNFRHMPELEHEHGYPVALAFMAFVAAVIWLWFKRKGWIGSRKPG